MMLSLGGPMLKNKKNYVRKFTVSYLLTLRGSLVVEVDSKLKTLVNSGAKHIPLFSQRPLLLSLSYGRPFIV